MIAASAGDRSLAVVLVIGALLAMLSASRAPRAERIGWMAGAVTAVLLALARWTDGALRAGDRLLQRSSGEGWRYEGRTFFQVAAVVAAGIVFLVVVAIVWRASRKLAGSLRLALGGVLLVLSVEGLRFISHHDVDRVRRAMIAGQTLGDWTAWFGALILAVVAGSFVVARFSASDGASPHG